MIDANELEYAMRCLHCERDITEKSNYCPFCGSRQSNHVKESESRIDAFYARALIEVEECEQEKSLWARALVLSEGDEQKAISSYIKMRVERLREAMEYEDQFHGQEESRSPNSDENSDSEEILTPEIGEHKSDGRPEALESNFTNLLFGAAREGSVENAVRALESGIDINTRNKHGATALYLAVINNRVELARYLLDAGANSEIPYYTGKTARDVALTLGSQEMQLLFKR